VATDTMGTLPITDEQRKEGTVSMKRLEQISPVEMPEVLRIASELHARDQVQIQRATQREELVRAAVEAGLPVEYLERAAASIQARRGALSRRRRQSVALAVLGLGLSLLAVRTFVPAPHTQLQPWLPPTAYGYPSSRLVVGYGSTGGPPITGYSTAGGPPIQGYGTAGGPPRFRAVVPPEDHPPDRR
jgi:hypothetical protein